MKIAILSRDPEILLVRDFLTEDENRHLLASAEGKFRRSSVTCANPAGCVSDHRTSSSAYLSRDFVTNGVSAKAVALAGMNRDCDPEDLQVVKYEIGQEFKGHVDCVDPKTLEGRRELAKYNNKNRSATFLAYLNDGFGGGATYFPKVGVRVTPERNAAVFWRNMLPDGSIDPRTFHGGEALLSGTKYAVNIWLRGGRYVGKQAVLGRRMGEVSTFAKDAAVLAKHGVVTSREPYALQGTSSLRKTLQEMGRMIREARISPAMRSFAEHVVKEAGVPSSKQISDREAASIFLAYVRANVRYRPDPDMTEYVLAAPVTLCVPGAPMCIPVGDCDDLTVALASLMAAYGMQVRLLKQDWGDDQEHVLIVFLDTSTSNGMSNGGGSWLAADPSSPDKPVGWKMGGAKEVMIDPSDPKTLDLVDAPAAEYIGVGQLPLARLPIRALAQVPVAATATSIQKAYTDLYNIVGLPIINGDTLLAAGEYSDAITAYQAACNVAVNTVGPEISAMDTTGATANYFAAAVALNSQLAAISATGSDTTSALNTSGTGTDVAQASQSDAQSAQALAKQILTMYQIALETVSTTVIANKQTNKMSFGVGDLLIGGAAVATVGGIVWGMARRANAPRSPRLRARRAR